MANFCIVCEYNPLHNGHKYLIDKAKELGADTVTCIMSGNSTQRGELSLTDKYLRAEAAIRCGADLVLELPFPWCSGSADYFSLAAVKIASWVGDTLIFGSELGDLEILSEAARICETEEFKRRFEECSRSGVGSAAAYVYCMSKAGVDSVKSNDILGISYIRAINRLGVSLKPLAVKRLGAAYGEKEAVEGEYQSATALRGMLDSGKLGEIEKYVPKPMADILNAESANGRLTEIKYVDSAVLAYYRLSPQSNFEGIAEMSGGLENRIISAAKQSKSIEEMLSKIKTKRYTDSKLRRAMLFGLVGVTEAELRKLPRYSLLLGANKKGRDILSGIRKSEDITIVTKPADAPKDTPQYALNEKLDALYGLARRKGYTADEFIVKRAYIEK